MANRPIIACGSCEVPIWRKGYRPHVIAMTLKEQHLCAGMQIPQAHRAIMDTFITPPTAGGEGVLAPDSHRPHRMGVPDKPAHGLTNPRFVRRKKSRR